jgi:hypothetical protein
LGEVVGGEAGAFFDCEFDFAFFFIFRDNSVPPASRVSTALPLSRNCKTANQPKSRERSFDSRTFHCPASRLPSFN